MSNVVMSSDNEENIRRMYKKGATAKLNYPQGCKEIGEDLPTDDLIRRMKDIAMAFQQMSQEDNNDNYVALAKYLATDYFLEHQSRDVRLLVSCAPNAPYQDPELIKRIFLFFIQQLRAFQQMAFQQMSQEDNNDNYVALAKYLATDYFLEHQSRDVRLLVACAPNAPYQDPELIKRIFLFFIQQLRGLQDPKDATFKRYFYLLENLAWVKSFNICIELEDSQNIFCQLFSLIFKIVNDNHSDKVKNFMLDMLTPLILEADTVSQKLIEIILWQIIDPKKTHNKQACWLATQILKKTSKTMEPYLISYFNNAVTHGVHANAGDLSDNEEEAVQAPQMKKNSRGIKQTSSQSQSVTQLCELIYELNQICPSIMDGILPQVDYKIRSNEERERCEFTKLLARLFSDKNSNLAEQYPDLWKSFLGRFRDISVTVRMRCVQYSMHFLVNHPELREDITEQLKQRQHDPDENVRYEVVMAIIFGAKKGIENINEDLLSFVKERTLDKKFKIRKEALLGMAQLYKQYNVAALGDESPDEIASNNNAALKMLHWIKNKCLHNYYQSLLDDRLLVERILHTCLIPYSLALPQRMKTLYTLYATIDGNAARAFNELLKQQLSVRKQVKEVFDILKEEKTDERDTLMKQKVLLCAKNLPEPVKADEYISKLCRNLELNPALRQHMEIIVTATSYPQINEDGSPMAPPSCATIEASVKEVLKSLGFPVQTNSFYVIIKQLMERIAPVMIDHQGLLILFNNVSDTLLGDGEIDAQYGIENSAKRGLQLILALSSVFPAIFYGREIFTDYLLPFLWQSNNEKPHIAELVLQILTNIGAAAGSFQSTDAQGAVPWWAADEETIPRLIEKFIINPASTKQAKYAIQCINAIVQDDNEKMKIFGQVLDQIKNSGLTLDSPYFRNHLVAIGMIATCGGHIYFPKLLRSIIQKFVVQNLLLKDQRLPQEIASQEEAENMRDACDAGLTYELCSEETKCKVEAIKLMARWLHGLKLSTLVGSSDQNEAMNQYQKAASNTLQLLKTLVQNGGDLNEQGLGGTTREKAHLRITAASAMLKIVSNDSLTSATPNEVASQVTSATSPIITPTQWHVLAMVLLDQEDFVREKFALKLHKLLLTLSLGLEFLAILCLAGTFETNSPFRVKLRNFLLLNLAKRRDVVKSKNVVSLKATMPDCVMPFVIHLLAHAPFYTQYDDIKQLDTVKECLWFIMDPLVLKNEHYSFSFYKRTFENIKTCVDKVSAPANGEADSSGTSISTMTNYKIYCACDLALGLVMSKTQNFLLKDFPVQPSLPGKYYTVSQSAVDNNLNCYLPQEMQFAPPKRCGLEAEILGKITKSFNQATKQTVDLVDKAIHWAGGRNEPPPDTPQCGFDGSKCLEDVYPHYMVASCVLTGILFVLCIGSYQIARHYKLEAELSAMSWKIKWEDILTTNKRSAAQKRLGSMVSINRFSSSSTLSAETVACHDMNKQMFIRNGYYKGSVVAIKPINTPVVTVTRALMLEMKRVKDLQHDHVVRFIGACLDPPVTCLITEYCPKGSLADILENDQIKLDWMFKYSLMHDLIKGMAYLHGCEIIHGNLKSSNCVVDSRFVLKVTDFGLHDLRGGDENDNDDSYAHWRQIVEFVKKGQTPPIRPALQGEDCDEEIVHMMSKCWSENSIDRPDFQTLKLVIRKLNKDNESGNILDNLLSRMEQYASNLEALVEERTADYLDEKRKAESLLYELLPKPVACELIKGDSVTAETYESVTIYFSDIVGFTALSSQSTPMEIIGLLNNLYTCFDSILENFDVYKVETIGDAYMMVSGLPCSNGLRHAREIARMSIELLKAVHSFTIKHRPNDQLKLRIEIHSGACAAGVVGLKMPRYCLFGDTVNTASRMESTGLTLRIHVSPKTKEILDSLSSENVFFKTRLRGEVEMKGKGKMSTYWLVGETDEKGNVISEVPVPSDE